MTGCRNLTRPEINKVIKSFTGRYENRDRLLFVLGISTGYRISELLSIKVSDVWNGDRVFNNVVVKAGNTKTNQGRSVPLNSSAQQAITRWLEDPVRPESEYLFSSRKGGRITRQQADRILKKVFNEAQLDGMLATHTLRKTYANLMLALDDTDIRTVSRYLGHKDVNVTERYLGIDSEKDVQRAEAIAVDI